MKWKNRLIEPKFGDKIRLLGTKEGKSDSEWRRFFESKGRVKNTIEKISGIRRSSVKNEMIYFSNSKPGYMTREDFEVIRE